MGMDRGFGVAGALDRSIIDVVARGAELHGYSTFWVNDTPGGDGLDALARAAAVTETIGLGVGVIPIDRRPPQEIAARINALGLPLDRLIVGIGSGELQKDTVEITSGAAEELRTLTSARVVIGALGPRMTAAGATHSDGVLLNWLTASFAAESAAAIRTDRATSWIGAYVRVALPGAGAERAALEGERYGGYPAYARHFARMGADPRETMVLGDVAAIQTGLAAYRGVDEVVVRAIAAEESAADYLALVVAARPSVR